MQSVEYDSVNQLVDRLERSKKTFQVEREKVLEEIGADLLRTVRGNIAGTGTVQQWQDVFLGSRLGYAAVRAKARTYQDTKGGKRYAVGHVTNAIENGHKVRGPSGRAKRYRSRLKSHSTRVPGKYMYLKTLYKLDTIAKDGAKRVLEAVVREVDD